MFFSFFSFCFRCFACFRFFFRFSVLFFLCANWIYTGGGTVLHTACERGKLVCVKVLLENNIDVDAQGKKISALFFFPFPLSISPSFSPFSLRSPHLSSYFFCLQTIVAGLPSNVRCVRREKRQALPYTTACSCSSKGSSL